MQQSWFLCHSYIVGRSGSGKTELIKSVFDFIDGAKVVLDPHGDLARDIHFSNRYIAPNESRFVINPFDIQDKSERNIDLVAEEITDLIAEMVEDVGLSRLMGTISYPIIHTLLKLPYADFKMFADCVHPESGKERLKALRHLVEPHLLATWEDLEQDTYDTSKQSVFNRLRSFLNKRLIMQTLCGRDDFGAVIEHLEKGKSVVVSLPIPDIGEDVAKTIGRFIMCRMQIFAKRRNAIPEHLRTPVFLFVDEFQNFLSQATANTLDQFGRKFKLYMIFAHQHIGQLTDREIRGSVLANTKNKIAGVSNSDTRQAVAREMMLKPEELENLSIGNFYAKFGEREPMRFYAKQAHFERGEKDYFPSKNTPEMINGWDGIDREPGIEKAAPGRPRKTPPKPKFEI